MRTISQILLEDYSIRLRPGAKGECPQCHGHNFSIKHGDQLGKCFSPQCGYTLTAARDHEHAHASLPRVLDSVYEACHHALLDLASRPTSAQNAYRYLTEERGIHPQVVNDALLGVVPAGFDVRTHFQPVLADAEADVARLKREQRGRPTKQYETAAKRLTDLQETQQRLHECLAHKAAWLIFFYTDAHHRLVALRLRQPYTKKFVSFKPGSAGVFGRELFTPYVTPDKQPLNGFLLVVEGEFNVLQLQALMVRYEEATGETLGYLNACAVGGVLGADLDTLTRVAQHPVIVYDHDTNQAGFELVRRLQQVMPVEACTTPLPCGEKSDLDSYIRDFGQDHMAAWEGSNAHKRELTALSPCSTPSSCRLLLSVRACTGSMGQPGSHRGFLMPPTPSTTAEKAAQTGEARLETGLRPPALHLLPQRLQPQPAHQPTAHHDARG